MPDLSAHYQHYYMTLSEHERRRYWIQLANEGRQVYQHVESMLAKVANSELEFRVLWKPEK